MVGKLKGQRDGLKVEVEEERVSGDKTVFFFLIKNFFGVTYIVTCCEREEK